MSARRSWSSPSSPPRLRLASVVAACLLAVVAIPRTGGAQCAANEFCVHYDKTTTATSGSTPASSLSWNHMAAIGVNRALVVGVSIRRTSGLRLPSVSSITFAGIDLELIDGVTSIDGELRAEIWGLAGDGPDGVAGGENTVVVTLTGSAQTVGASVSFTGVDPSTPFFGTSARGDSTLMISTIPQAGLTSVCVDVTATRADNSATAAYADQVERWNINTGSTADNLLSTGSTRPGSGGRNTWVDWYLGSAAIWATAATEVVPYASTEIRLSAFDAVAHGDRGVALRWRTGGDRGTLGFRLYREDESGELQPVSRELIAGSALLSKVTLEAGYSYAWPDPGGSAGSRYWLEEVEIDGGLHRYGPFAAAPATDRDATLETASPTLRALTPARTRPSAVTVPTGGEQAKALPTGDLRRQLKLASNPSAIRIGITERGWYRIDQAALAGAGLDPQARTDLLQVYAFGRQTPIRVEDGGDGRLDPGDAISFYAVGVDEEATDTMVYWLVVGDEPGLRIPSASSGVVGAEITTVPSTLELRERLVYVASFANGDDTNFFGEVLVGSPVDQRLSASQVDFAAPDTATLELVLRGFTDGAHTVGVEINGLPVATLAGMDQDEIRQIVPVPVAALVEGENVVRLTPGPAGDITLVEVIRLGYPRRTVATDNELLATLPDTAAPFAITGFTEPGALVLDVSDPFAVTDLTANAVRQPGLLPGNRGSRSTYTALFRLPQTTGRTIHALAPGRTRQPAWVAANQPSIWSTRRKSADVIVVAPRAMVGALGPLVAYRTWQGHRLAVIAIEDVYDERSFGVKRPQAIRDLVADLVDRWRGEPRYLILAGDASYDPRDFLGLGGVDLVPTKFIATDAFEAASDDWFADVDDDGFPDLMVGRLPAKSVAELEALVSKTLDYDRAATAWTSALYVSDDDIGRQFEMSNQTFIQQLPMLAADHVKVGDIGNAAARQAVIDALDSGVDLVTYVGHGSVESWSGGVLDVPTVALLSPTAQPSLFAMLDCMNGYFFDAALDSLAEALLAHPAGAVAVYAPTGMTGHAPQEEMMSAFYDAIAANTAGLTLGEAASAAKRRTTSDEVRRTWVVLGDPMIALH